LVARIVKEGGAKMMKRWCAVVGALATICLYLGGCNGAAGEKPESSAEVKQLKTALQESQQQKTQLQGDVTRLEKSLNEAESGSPTPRRSRTIFRSRCRI
jgi:uncharacterized protein HemX